MRNDTNPYHFVILVLVMTEGTSSNKDETPVEEFHDIECDDTACQPRWHCYLKLPDLVKYPYP